MTKTQDIPAQTVNFIMKYFKFYCSILFAIFYSQSSLICQTIFPPNYSFEDDTANYSVEPWNVQGKYSTFSSFGMNLPTDRYRLFAMQSFKVKDTITNSKISLKFPLNQRVNYLKFDAIFFSQFDFENFGVKLILTKYDKFKSEIVTVCKLDTLMDTICNFRDYRSKWVTTKIDLTRFYLNSDIPDSCYIEFNCDIDYNGPFNFNQSLFLDNIKFTLSKNTELVNLMDNNDIQVYPNPAETNLHIDLGEIEQIQSFQLVNTLGETLLTVNDPNDGFDLDVSDYPPGLYFIRVSDTLGNTYIRKVQIQ